MEKNSLNDAGGDFGGLWSDRRSGAVGQLIGEIALNRLRRVGEMWQKKPGTTFRGDHRIVIGRTAKESYCRRSGGCHHWANVSSRQLTAFKNRWKNDPIFYLFVSLTEPENAIRTWIVPAAVIEQHVFARERRKKTDEYDVKIVLNDGIWMIADADVSAFYQEFTLDPRERRAVAEALPAEPAPSVEELMEPLVDNAAPLPPQPVAPRSTDSGGFRLDLRIAGRQIRVTGQIDVMADAG
jgi:hypothetical protein